MAVTPAAAGLGEIGLPLGSIGLGDRTDEQFEAEHELILLSQGLWVVGKVKDQGTHQRIALGADATGTLLDIGPQGLAFLDAVGNNGLCLLAVVPRLGIAHIAMHAHQQQYEDAQL